MKKRLMGIVLAMAAFVLVACGQGDQKKETVKDGDKLNIVTSFYPMHEFTKEVAGDRAEVSVLVTGGEGAHGYEPSAKDIAKLNDADVFVYSSDQMEYWVEDMLDSVDNKDLKVVLASDFSEELAEAAAHDHDEHDDHDHDDHDEHDHDHDDHDHDDHDDHDEHDHDDHGDHDEHDHDDHDHDDHDHDHDDHDHDHDHGGIDPHNWIDPVAVKEQVEAIKDALIEVDPDGEAEYTKNAQKFQDQLTELDNEYQEALAGAKNRIFVVQHQAFGHLANRYNLEQVSAGGINTEAEPTPADIARVTAVVEETKVPVIYYQSGANSKVAETIAAETGTEVAVLYDLERSPEDVDDKDKKHSGYIDAMKFNLKQLEKSIQ